MFSIDKGIGGAGSDVGRATQGNGVLRPSKASHSKHRIVLRSATGAPHSCVFVQWPVVDMPNRWHTEPHIDRQIE